VEKRLADQPKTTRQLEPERPLAEYGTRQPRYRQEEISKKFVSRVIWVEPRENTLAPVGEGFLFKYQHSRFVRSFSDG